MKKYSLDGSLVANIECPFNNYAYIFKDLKVTSEGIVYQILPTVDYLKIIKYFPEEQYNDKTISIKELKKSLSLKSESSKLRQLDISPKEILQGEPLPEISRDEAMARAVAYKEHSFYVGWENITTGDNCGGKTVKTCSGTSGVCNPGNYIGVRYKWGGFSGLKGVSCNTGCGYYFDEGLEGDNYAGDICSAYDPDCEGIYYGSCCAVGVDCSGFVSQCWGLREKYGSSTLTNISNELSKLSSLLKGDMLYKPGHVMLCASDYPSSVTGIDVYESRGYDWQVVNKHYSYSELSGSYSPYRYSKIQSHSNSDKFSVGDSVITTDSLYFRIGPGACFDEVEGIADNPLPLGTQGQIIEDEYNRNGIYVFSDVDGNSHYHWWHVKVDDYSGWCAEPWLELSSTSEPNLIYSIHFIDDDTSGDSNGDDDWQVDPGEIIEMPVTLKNSGDTAAHNVSGELITADDYVTINEGIEQYPDIYEGGEETCIDDYEFEVSSLCPDGHYITFTLYINSDEGTWTDSFVIQVHAEQNQTPNTPTNENPSDNSYSVPIGTDLDWTCSDPNDDTLYYTVYFEKNDSSPENTITADSTGSYVYLESLDYDSHYYWKVKADDHNGGTTTGPVWDFWTESAPIQIPDSPSNLTANPVSSSQIDLNWQDNSNNEDGFRIYRDGSQIATVGANTTTYPDTDFSSNTQYCYEVSAYNSAGESSHSSQDCATTGEEVPDPPSSLTANAASSSRIDLNWQDNSNNEDGFRIYRDDSQIATVGANTTTYPDTDFSSNTQYCYEVSAYNSAGESSHSSQDCVKIEETQALPWLHLLLSN